MKRLLLLLTLTAAAFSSGCDDGNDPDPYLYNSAALGENGGAYNFSGGY